jgi:type II secretory ATPase GspE/PulE/Tfp pilus assembly ATPase PilB-like protein/CheY-like chemotaxis protein
MHWLGQAATRAGLKGATMTVIPPGTTTVDAWEIGARSLGVTPSELASKVAGAMQLHSANFATADAKTLRLVPEKLARRYTVFPMRETHGQIVIATADPGNIECEQSVAFAAGRRVIFELAAPHQITQAINSSYSRDRSMEHALDDVGEELADAVKVLQSLKPEVVAVQEVDAAPVVRLTNLLLRDAVGQRASDIHIEPGETHGNVRFRVDGVMREHLQIPMAALNRVVSRIKVLSRLDIADRIRPQDGRTRVQVDGKTYDLRVSTVPIRESEKCVIRILRPNINTRLDDVGIADTEITQLRRLLGYREGIVFVTGPTGSGKTTTMYGALGELRNGDVNITTVEDPVEYELPGTAQIQVDVKRGVTFASALRAILRQDPDVIFVGEIRDLETAQIAVQAAMTGHLVLATLHTNDAVGAIGRLEDLGLDRTQIGATVRGSIAQRLIRRVCEECAVRITGELTAEESRLSKLFEVTPTVRATGCSRCSNSGFFGRVPIHEVATFAPMLNEQIARGASLSALQRMALAGGMRTLRMSALDRVARGETTLAEVERVVGDTGDAAAREPKQPIVLVVDDDPVERLLVTSVLEQSGFRVSQVDDGSAALERLGENHECSIVVTDLRMKQIDGDELIRRIRTNPRTRALPVLVITGSAESEMEEQLIEAGADDYIRKPLDPPKLVARVRAALRRAAA